MELMSVEKIRELCKNQKLRWTNHIEVRLLQRNIATSDIEYALLNCEIIEQYPDAYPYPACLVLGITVNSIRLHVVCGASETELWLITAYYPDMSEWNNDCRTRKEQ